MCVCGGLGSDLIGFVDVSIPAVELLPCLLENVSIFMTRA
jgi:hypothetical protein